MKELEAIENDFKLLNEKENESMQIIVELTTLEEKYHNVEKVMKSFEIKIEILENDLTTVKKCLVEKDTYAVSLESKIKKMEKANDEQKIEIEDLLSENLGPF